MQEKKQDREPFTEKGGRSVPERELTERVENGFGKANDRGGKDQARKITDRRGTGQVDKDYNDE